MATTPFAVSGLISGIDTSALVTQLVNAEKAPINRLNAEKTSRQRAATSVQSLIDKLKNLQTQVQELESGAALNVSKVQVGGGSGTSSAPLSATPSGATAQGTYSVIVGQLAKAQRNYSSGFAASDQAGLFGTGQLSIAVGTNAAVDVAVDASDTLTTVANKINAQASGVSAGVVYDGSSYRLSITGRKSGAANAVTFSETGTSLGLSAPASVVVTAQDAKVSVDGFLISSASNILPEAIAGISLTLNSVSSGASFDANTQTIVGGTGTEISVSPDTAAMKTKVSTLVTTINDIFKDVKSFSTTQKTQDSSINAITTRLRSIIGSSVSGLDQAMSSLSQIGISTNRDGTLSLKESTLEGLLAKDSSAVSRLFEKTSSTTGIASTLDDAITAFVASSGGTLVMKKQSIEAYTKTIDQKVDAMTKRLDSYETRMRKQFSAMEQSMAKLNQAAGALGSMVSIKA